MSAPSLPSVVAFDPVIASLWTGTTECTLTIFGRPVAGFSDAQADYWRGQLAELDDCPDCSFYLRRHPTAQPTVINTERIRK